jgi:hypothetical protein
MDTLRVLLVEDEASKVAEWGTAVEFHNADAAKNGFLIETVHAATLNGAVSAIDTHRIDAAVVDLRLQREEGVADHNSDGNEFVKVLIERLPVGVVVYTGQQHEVVDYGVQVQVLSKGEGLGPVLTWLGSQRDVLMRSRSASGVFAKEMARVFFHSIWPRWSAWTEDAEVKTAELEHMLTRHVVAHVHDALLHGNPASHPEEAYFVPAIKDRLDTGDLIDLDGGVWVIVTPRCDLATEDKVDTILLAQCDDISKEWAELVAKPSAKAAGKRSAIAQHEKMPGKHFLAQMRVDSNQVRGPWMVRFHKLRSEDRTTQMAVLRKARFASISPSFVPSLVERFGSYFSRIGTPNVSV